MGLEQIRKLKKDAGKSKPPKNKKPIKRKQKKAPGGGAKMTRWFEERRTEMRGRCAHCGGPTSAWSNVYYRFCIAHILPKHLFKSVAAHPLNWIELCHFGNSCHTNLDNNTLDLIELNCYDIVIERFVSMYPVIAKEERKFIPDVLLQYINTDI